MISVLPFTEVRNLLILAYALIDVNPCETFDYPGEAAYLTQIFRALTTLLGVQIYPSCIQVEVTGSGTAFPISFVSFPGAYTPDTPGALHPLFSRISLN